MKIEIKKRRSDVWSSKEKKGKEDRSGCGWARTRAMWLVLSTHARLKFSQWS